MIMVMTGARPFCNRRILVYILNCGVCAMYTYILKCAVVLVFIVHNDGNWMDVEVINR